MEREDRGDRNGGRGGDRDDKKRPVGRRKMCKFCGDETIKIDYKDAGLLKYSSLIAASWCPAVSRATAPSTSARSRRRSTALA
jgi:hypothetical protein